MNDNIYELLLINNEKNLSYLIDVFQENTIRSQEVILDIIDLYRKKFLSLDKKIFSLIFRKIHIWEWDTENIIKIKDSSLFIYKNTELKFENEDIISREVKELNIIDYKL